ncbi:hypothetical protein HNV12_01010 [Methanococcoides sp. SA1]|nr:hypothetical protein [Methanococcoides sp. SA1]
MVEVKFRLQKRDFVWMGLIVVLLGVGFVFAYGSSNPSVMGHSTGEMSYRSMCEGACDSPSIDRPGGGVGQVVVDDPFYVSNNMYVGGKFAAASVSDAFCRLITGHNCGAVAIVPQRVVGTTRDLGNSASYSDAVCPSGKVLVGGGCQCLDNSNAGAWNNYPVDSRTWRCYMNPCGNAKAYALCV